MIYLTGCDVPGRTLQFDADLQSWFVVEKSTKILVGDQSDDAILALLPFLELPIADFKVQVSVWKQVHSVKNFPFEMFICAGFRHGSPHWVDCAMQWLAALKGIKYDFTTDLEKILLNKKKYSQRIRQMALFLLRGNTRRVTV